MRFGQSFEYAMSGKGDGDYTHTHKGQNRSGLVMTASAYCHLAQARRDSLRGSGKNVVWFTAYFYPKVTSLGPTRAALRGHLDH